MRFPPSLLDEIRARLPVSQVVGRRVKLKRQGREFIGLSPFKVEKTPSFTVNDQKGFYHCFATGEHGDIFRFVMKTEGLAFPEAVERLASEAGVSLPTPTPHEHQQADRRARLLEAADAAARYFQDQLTRPAGREALAYSEGRGLTRETLARFRIGYALGGRSALKEHLAGLGFSVSDMTESGLLIHGDDIPVPYDRFRNRLIFPITDARDRVVGFGGRALAADAKPKYLNSPETPLFHKGTLLFNAAKARGPAHERARVVVVEGYMDVIGLAQAGFPEAVAPLGTALTPEQLALVWRFCPEPILCFDGDGAGRRAAFRALETALPHLKPGQTLKFAFLPEGLDPDDLVRQHGAAAFQGVLDRALPLIDVLFRKESDASTATPEARAASDERILSMVQTIADRTVRDHYLAEVRQTLRTRNFQIVKSLATSDGRRAFKDAASRPNNTEIDWRVRQRQQNPAPRRSPGVRPAAPPAGASNSLRAQTSACDITFPPREALLMVTLMRHPWLIDEFMEEIAALPLASAALGRLRDELLRLHAYQSPLDTEMVSHQIGKLGLDGVSQLASKALSHRSDRFADPEASRDEVIRGWRHVFALQERETGLRRELLAAQQSWDEDQSEESYARIRELSRLLNESASALAPEDDDALDQTQGETLASLVSGLRGSG
ncbi:MAG: DNA primase [Hyphomicrobiaceae bacterium]|nr:DNA primase [Hyphomicrobiaceae bacterium]